MATPSVYHHRARIAALSRSRSADDPDLVEARRNLRAEKLAQHIERVVNEAPPLSDAMRDRLAGILRGGAPPGSVAGSAPPGGSTSPAQRHRAGAA